LREHGLRINPKKTLLFRSTVAYMGHIIAIIEGRPCVMAQKDKCQAIIDLKPPCTRKQVKSLIGACLFLGMYLANLQVILKPLHALTKKGATFSWLPEHQVAFEKIKTMLVEPPVLIMPQKEGELIMYSDASIHGCGAALYQKGLDGVERLIAYHSKSLPKSAPRWGISEIEMMGIYINIIAFSSLLRNRKFTVVTDHHALVSIMKSKREPPTMRFKKIIERLSPYDFDLAFLAGKKMVVADYLSRNTADKGEDPNEIIPIALSVVDEYESDWSLDDSSDEDSELDSEEDDEIYHALTRAKAREKNITVPPLFPTGRIAQQDRQNATRGDKTQVTSKTRVTPMSHKTVLENRFRNEGVLNNNQPTVTQVNTPEPRQRQTLVDPSVLLTPSPWASQIKSPHPSGVTETHVQPNEDLFRQPKPLLTKVNPDTMLTRHIPKQEEIQKLLDVIKTRCLRDYHLPFEVRTLIKEQKSCPSFGEVYAYISTGRLPSKKQAARGVIVEAENYVIVESVLFRVVMNDPFGQSPCRATLVIPDSMVPSIISLFHDSLLGNHSGITRCYLAIRQKFHIKRLFSLLYNYVRSCTQCALQRMPKEISREYAMRVPESFEPMAYLQADCKAMPESFDGFKWFLLITCEISRYCICVAMKKIDAVSIAEAILQECALVIRPPKRIVMDQDRALGSKVMKLIFDALKVDLRFISVENHASLTAERHIGTISSFLARNLTNSGRNWPLYLKSSVWAYNTQPLPSLGLSPYSMVFGVDPPTVGALEFGDINSVPMSTRDYVEMLKSRLQHIGRTVLDIQAKIQQKQANKQAQKFPEGAPWRPGLLVYLLAPSAAALKMNTRKRGLRLDWCGPFYIDTVLDESHVVLRGLDSRLLVGVYHTNRLKIAYVRTGSGITNKLEELQKGMRNKTGSQPTTKEEKVFIVDENDCQPIESNQADLIWATKDHEINLSQVQQNAQANCLIACSEVIESPSVMSQLYKHTQKVQESTPDYAIVKARYKCGSLEVYVTKSAVKQRSNTWKRKEFRKLLDKRSKGDIQCSVDTNYSFTALDTLWFHNDGKSIGFWLDVSNHPQLALQVRKDEKLKVCGSIDRFGKRLLY